MLSPLYYHSFNLCICDLVYLKIKDICCRVLKLRVSSEGPKMKCLRLSHTKVTQNTLRTNVKGKTTKLLGKK